MKIFIVLIVLGFIITCTNSNNVSNLEWENTGNLIDSTTSVKIAKDILVSIYGNMVLSEEPFIASLFQDSIWVVKGSIPKGIEGGVSEILINRKNCQIINLEHGK